MRWRIRRKIHWLWTHRPRGWRAAIKRQKAKLHRIPPQHRTHEEALLLRLLRTVDYWVKRDPPYVWGGGHGTPANLNNGGDCSAYGSLLCQTLVQGITTGTTFSLAEDAANSHNGMREGPGRILTLYIKNSPASDAHVICRITDPRDGHTIGWTECGGRDNASHGHNDGPCWFNPTQERIHEFPILCHPVGC